MRVAIHLLRSVKRVKREPGEPALNFVGEPLPGHLLLLRPGSSFFKSQANRWTGNQPAGAKPELRVQLEHADDLPYALAAIGFIYTGELAGSPGTRELLGVRRLASFLGVKGCLEAVDTALLTVAQSGLMGVLRLYSRRELLPNGHDPAASALLPRLRAACREQLVKHAGNLQPDVSLSLPLQGGGSVKAGELLAWAFPDAPSMLSDPATKNQLLALPGAALEALLSSAGFAADSEDSVLLLLGCWFDANPATSSHRFKRLRRYVRLCQLSSVYFHGVLPLLKWFPVGAAELRFLCQYKEAPAGPLRQQLTDAGKAAGYALSSAWYSAFARPKCRSDAGRPYTWAVSKQTLELELSRSRRSSRDSPAFMRGAFSHGAKRVVARGFEWHLSLEDERGADKAGVYLYCTLPRVLGVGGADASALVGAACPGPCRAVVWRWRQDGGREEAFGFNFGSTHFQVGSAMGVATALLLQATPIDGASTAAARWQPFLRGDKVSGTLTWT
ncbi:hypothetical protein HYH03_011008 [Edaphochlamys debaryana]|uniref:BACK domain-containing protein n=1 Tax=Edaphochlamys debaryana TaxID=47281 RepID=A0A836BVG4_9CHLO|nr:hypothetical protein HYH03_011008 [Edaphochlamys debaryana]|eukprot:KAG2490616.1 hypothetical protein HYH03_011008 [Edaphochlamys debaryana]